MPSLWKRENSPYWTCCYTSADGQRLKKSTKQTDRKKALEVCLAIERAEHFAKAGTLTEQTAKKLIGEILERTTGEALHSYKAGEWLAQWLAAKEQVRAGKTGGTVSASNSRLHGLAWHPRESSACEHHANTFSLYRDAETKAGKMGRTANLSVKVVSAAFNAALRQGYITNNPCTALESLPVETEEKGTFSPEQVARLVEAAEGDWKGAILLGFYTGLRLRDVANIRWQAVDFKRQILTFTPSKTKKPMVIPLHAELEAHFLKSPGIGNAFVFPSLAGKGTGGKHGLSGRFSAIMPRAGIEGKTNREGLRARTSLSFHSLRHSFNSMMANAGVSQEIRQKLTGHASAEMNKIYTHHELAPLRAAIATIPGVQRKGRA